MAEGKNNIKIVSTNNAEWAKMIKGASKEIISDEPNTIFSKEDIGDKPGNSNSSYNSGGNRYLDNYYGNSTQMAQGDCYLLATINSIRNLRNGQEILRNLRTEKIVNGKKIYTFKFPGAKLAAEGLKKDNLKNGVFITGEYTFTEDEVRRLAYNQGVKYSYGDMDVVLLEAAFEKYRKEVQKTLEANNLPLSKYFTKAGMVSGKNTDNILEGGWAHDAIYVLTGKKSEMYKSLFPKMVPALSVDALNNNKVVPAIDPSAFTYGVNSYEEIDGSIKKTNVALNKMLDKIQEDYENDRHNDKIATAGFMVSDEKGRGGHTFSIKKVTSDKVILINSWCPEKELIMTREQFLAYATYMTVSADETPKSLWQRFKEFTGLDQLF